MCGGGTLNKQSKESATACVAAAGEVVAGNVRLRIVRATGAASEKCGRWTYRGMPVLLSSLVRHVECCRPLVSYVPPFKPLVAATTQRETVRLH